MNLAALSVAVCSACSGVKPARYEQGQLLVEAEAREDVHAGGRIGAGHERHAGAEHGKRHVELHLHELLAHRQRDRCPWSFMMSLTNMGQVRSFHAAGAYLVSGSWLLSMSSISHCPRSQTRVGTCQV